MCSVMRKNTELSSRNMAAVKMDMELYELLPLRKLIQVTQLVKKSPHI